MTDKEGTLRQELDLVQSRVAYELQRRDEEEARRRREEWRAEQRALMEAVPEHWERLSAELRRAASGGKKSYEYRWSGEQVAADRFIAEQLAMLARQEGFLVRVHPVSVSTTGMDPEGYGGTTRASGGFTISWGVS